MRETRWELVSDQHFTTWRGSVPGGWLYVVSGNTGMVFVPVAEPEPDHTDGIPKEDFDLERLVMAANKALSHLRLYVGADGSNERHSIIAALNYSLDKMGRLER